MTKILIDRSTVEQALEALEGGADSWQRVGPAIDALKAALAEQRLTDMEQKMERSIESLKSALAEPVQEPVAWLYTGIKQDGTEHGHLVWRPAYMDAMSASKGAQATPLYAHPPQRKPLDDLAIADIYTKWDATPGTSMADFARAIERAHGIV